MSHAAAFRRWLSAFTPARRTALGSPRRRARVRTVAGRLVLEQLEDRMVLSNFVVTSLNDSGPGSLREAIDSANATTSSVIDFAVTGAIDLVSQLELTANITIAGPGSEKLTVEPASANQNSFGIFSIGSDVIVRISGLTIANGATTVEGGGIFNAGTLTVTDCDFNNDSSPEAGGAIANSNAGTLTVANCTFNNDFISGGDPNLTRNSMGWAAPS